MLVWPSVASANNGDIPFYNGNEDTSLKSPELQLNGKLLRPEVVIKQKSSIIKRIYIFLLFIMVLLIGEFKGKPYPK